MNIFDWYDFIGLYRITRDVLVTKLFFRGCRIIRSPFYIRGGSGVDYGVGLTTGVGLRIDIINFKKTGIKKLKFGRSVQVNDYVHIGVVEYVEIEDDVLIGSHVLITDHNHGIYKGFEVSDINEKKINQKLSSSPIIIKKNVWIGDGCYILPGVTVGENSIIGANSVVNDNIPPNTIAVGSPAKAIKKWSNSKKSWIDIND